MPRFVFRDTSNNAGEANDVNRDTDEMAGINKENGKSHSKSMKTPKLVYPEELENSPEFTEYIKFSIGDITTTRKPRPDGGPSDVEGKQKKDIHSSVILYQPQDIEVSYDTNWEGEELGRVGAKVAKSLDGGSVTTSDIWDMVKSGAQAGKENAIDAVGEGVGLNASAVRRFKNQRVRNPHLKMIFKGISHREFSFSFQFTPKNEDEVKTVISIIKMFKYYSAPAISNNEDHFLFPSTFQIEFLMGTGQQNSNLFSFEETICKSAQVNYSPNSIWASFRNGFPVTVNLDLSFQETSIVTKESIANNNR